MRVMNSHLFRFYGYRLSIEDQSGSSYGQAPQKFSCCFGDYSLLSESTKCLSKLRKTRARPWPTTTSFCGPLLSVLLSLLKTRSRGDLPRWIMTVWNENDLTPNELLHSHRRRLIHRCRGHYLGKPRQFPDDLCPARSTGNRLVKCGRYRNWGVITFIRMHILLINRLPKLFHRGGIQ